MPDSEERVPYVPVLGVEDDLAGTIEALPLSFGDLPSSAADDLDVTIVGMRVRLATGAEEMRRDGTVYKDDRDKLELSLRVNNYEEAGIDQFIPQSFNLRPVVTKADGSITRGKPVQNSGWGQFLAALETWGISGDPRTASVFLLTEQTDLIGLHYHRKGERRKIEGSAGRAESEYTVYMPSEIYGWDNDVRAEHGLASIVSDPDVPNHFIKQQQTPRRAARAS